MTTANEKIYDDAIEKCNYLFKDKTQIRLYSTEKSYWIFLIGDAYYIGSMETEKLPPFFEHKKIHELVNQNGKLIATMQYLKLKN